MTRDSPALYGIELRTTRWAELVAWYRDALGLPPSVVVPDDQYALFASPGGRLAILGRLEVPAASRRWSLVIEVADLEAAAARLSDHGLDSGVPVEHAEGFWILSVHDPDGNRVDLLAWPGPVESGSSEA